MKFHLFSFIKFWSHTERSLTWVFTLIRSKTGQKSVKNSWLTFFLIIDQLNRKDIKYIYTIIEKVFFINFIERIESNYPIYCFYGHILRLLNTLIVQTECQAHTIYNELKTKVERLQGRCSTFLINFFPFFASNSTLASFTRIFLFIDQLLHL